MIRYGRSAPRSGWTRIRRVLPWLLIIVPLAIRLASVFTERTPGSHMPSSVRLMLAGSLMLGLGKLLNLRLRRSRFAGMTIRDLALALERRITGRR